MASTNLDQQIRERMQLFVAELSSLIKQSAVKSVTDALGNGDTALPKRRGMGRPGRRGSARRAASLGDGEAAAPKGRGSKKRGAKRSPKQLEHITEKLFTYVKENPGQRIEKVAADIGMRTKELTLPVKKLVADKKIATKGEKRATTYFAR
jgi:DNA-binding NtrC family response regulator